MSGAVVTLAESTGNAANELPFPPIAFGIIAFVVLTSLLLVTYAFRSFGSRH